MTVLKRYEHFLKIFWGAKIFQFFFNLWGSGTKKFGKIWEGYEKFSDMPHENILFLYESQLSSWLDRFQGVQYLKIKNFL